MVQHGATPSDSQTTRPTRLLLLREPPVYGGRALTGRASALVHALALAEGAPLGQGELVASVWPDDPPEHPRQSLQVVVSRTRRLLGEGALVRRGDGYALTLGAGEVDFTDLLRRSEQVSHVLTRRTPSSVVGLTEELPAVPDAAAEDADSPRGLLLARAAAALRRCRRARALALETLGRCREAVPLLLGLAPELPDDEAVLAALVRAEAWAVSPAAALRRYEEYRQRLSRIGAVPGPQLRAAHEAALAAENPVRQGVRTHPTPLLGREADILAVTDAVATGRLVTITGPGGVGKTRLAQEIASAAPLPVVRALTLTSVCPRPAGGDSPRSPEDRRPAVARLARELLGAMGQGTRAGEDPRSGLVRAVSAPGTLLVLDDCEHVVEPLAGLLGQLLAAAPRLHVLVTSRRTLDLAGEHVHRLAPLSAEAAAALFTQRALAARPRQHVDADDLDRLLPALEGVPLTIELAAARTRVMSVGQLTERLGNELPGQGGPRDLPDRQRSLTAVIDWSWQLLSDDQRRALSRCALLADGFRLETIEGVLGPEAAVLVDALVSHSLLDVDAADPPRLHMLASVRERVLDRLHEGPDAGPAHESVRRWALGLAEETLDLAQGRAVPETTDTLLAEEPSLVGELARALGDDGRGTRPEDALVLGAALLLCWTSSWYYDRLATWIPRLLEAATTPAPDPRGNTARMLILHHAATNAWLLGPLPESVRSRIPDSFPGEDAWLSGIRRVVRTPHAEWPALVEDADPWTAWAACSRVVMDLENRGELAAAVTLNRTLLARMRATGATLRQPVELELELDGLRLVLETGDYAMARAVCSRLLAEAERLAMRDVHVGALRLQRACCAVYLDPSPQKATALLADSAQLRAPGMAAFVAALLSGEMELLRGRPREAALAPRDHLERVRGDSSIPAASPWEIYGLAICLILDTELDEPTAAELEAPAMRRRGLRVLGQVLHDPAASRFDLPTTTALACAVGLSCAVGRPETGRAGARLLATAMACGPNQTSRLLSLTELGRRAEALDPELWAASRAEAAALNRAELLTRMSLLAHELAEGL